MDDAIESLRQWKMFEPDPAIWYYPVSELDHDPGRAMVRFYDFAGTKHLRPFTRSRKGKWRCRHAGGRWPLYGLAGVKTADRIYVCEGEKCADALRDLGLIAVTSSMGANGAESTNWRPLIGKDVVIFPDNDFAGLSYAEMVSNILRRASPSGKVSVVSLPDLAHKEDIYDWLDHRRLDGWEEERLIAELESLVTKIRSDTFIPRIAVIEPEVKVRVPRDHKKREVIEWLQDRLRGLPYLESPVLIEEGRMLGYSKRTIDRAKGLAGVGSRRLGAGWCYYLFDGREGESEEEGQECQLVKNANSRMPTVRLIRNKGNSSPLSGRE